MHEDYLNSELKSLINHLEYTKLRTTTKEMTERTTPQKKRRTKFVLCLMTAFQSATQSWKIFLISKLFRAANKGELYFRTNSVRHRHAGPAAVQQTLKPRSEVNAAPLAGQTTDTQCTIDCLHVFKLHFILKRCIFSHGAEHVKCRRVAKLATTRGPKPKYGHNGGRWSTCWKD